MATIGQPRANTGKQAWLYLQASIVGTLANFFSRFLFAEFMDFGWSVVMANYVGMVIVFILSYRYAFGVECFRWDMAIRFALVAHFGLGVVWIASLLMRWICEVGIEQLGYSSEADFMTLLLPEPFVVYGSKLIDGFCHGVGIVTGFFANFFGHKYFSFNNNYIRGKKWNI